MRQHEPVARLVVEARALQHLGRVQHRHGGGHADGGAGCVLPFGGEVCQSVSCVVFCFIECGRGLGMDWDGGERERRKCEKGVLV